jgi:uncharacterized protein (TIGR02646 family)
MKYIEKGSGPKELSEWFNADPLDEKGNKIFDEKGSKINRRYGQIPADIRAKVIEALLKEQGYICCYTGIRISEVNMHVEHLKPQSISKQNGDHDDIAYSNMLAAYPRGGCQFGARAREDWYDLENFIHPLNRLCETVFKFDLEGCIHPVADIDNDSPAKRTIAKLKLDHESIEEMRRQAIDEVFFPEDSILSEAKLRRIIDTGYSVRDSKGRYPHFCFIIEQVAKQVLRKVERDRQRRQAIQQTIQSKKQKRK